MAKTKRDVITEALRHIRVADIAEGASGEDYDRAAKIYDGVYAALDDLGEVGVSFPANVVPDWAYIPMVQMVAGRVCTAYNRPEFRGEYAAGLTAIRAYAANEARVSGRPAQANYF